MVLGAPELVPVGEGLRGNAEEDEPREEIREVARDELRGAETDNMLLLGMTEALAEMEEEGAVGVALGVLEGVRETEGEELGAEEWLELEM